MTPADRVRAMRRDLEKMRTDLAALEALLPSALTALSNAVGDGYGSGTDGPGNTISDPVASAIAQASDAIELDQTIRIAWSTMIEIPFAVSRHLRRARGLTPQPMPLTRPCSAGLAFAGYEEWGRRDKAGALVRCDEIADKAGLCIGCYHRRRRWAQNATRAT